jgi:transposase
VIRTGPANQNDARRLKELIGGLPLLPTKAGLVRQVLGVMADAGYGVAVLMAWVVTMGYRCLIKPLGKAGRKHGSGLGKKRYVVERSLSWISNFRRLKLCYERTWHSAQGFHELAAGIVCARRLQKIRTAAAKPSARL